MKITPAPDRGPARNHSDLYEEHLASREWATTRALVLARSGGRCEAPGCAEPASEVHHRSYARLGAEPLADLQALCPHCHAAADRRRQQARRAR